MADRIKPGTRVTWTGAGGGIREYSGEVVAYLPAGASLVSWECSRSIYWATPRNVDEARANRYVVATEDGHRVVSAALLERQNPAVPRG